MNDTELDLRSLYEAADTIRQSLQRDDDEQSQRVCARLRDSVLRPLAVVVQARDQALPTEIDENLSAAELREAVWQLARSATRLRAQRSDLPHLGEAGAALQDVAIAVAGDAAESRESELAALLGDIPPNIQVASNGPYLLTNARGLVDWLGQRSAMRPLMALCRCGKSESKPVCDGTHARVGFTDAKDPNRVTDRLDTYIGQQVTVLDNRGTCQHSGFCTDRLATVFRLREEPFVTPSGGRMDEIIRAVRDCPSGALSYAIDGVEARADVDYHGTREPQVEISKDGPYRITGGFELVDHEGVDIPRNHGASREHYSLCRCGQSQNKPFCSGMHYYVQFSDPTFDADHEPTVFEWAGGLPALTRMTRLFYEKYVPQDELLAPLFATMSADHPQRVAKWLAEVFGGPKNYSEDYGGYSRMLSQHVGKNLTEAQRTRWVTHLREAARDAGLPNDAEFRSAFESYIEWGTRLAVENSQSDARPPEHMPMPRWDWNTAAGPPGSRVSALAPSAAEDEAVVLPELDEAITFDAHIKPMFRQRDRQSMQFAFDLWSYGDVSQHADAILARLRDGTMPCDGAWPDARIDVFRRWIETGSRR